MDDLEVPHGFGEQGGVLTPEAGGAVFVGHVHIHPVFGLDEVMDAVVGGSDAPACAMRSAGRTPYSLCTDNLNDLGYNFLHLLRR